MSTVGVGFEEQMMHGDGDARIECESHDVRLDVIISPSAVAVAHDVNAEFDPPQAVHAPLHFFKAQQLY